MTDHEKLVAVLNEIEDDVGFICDSCGEAKKSICIESFADHLIANGVTVREWISVEDGLPDDDCDWVLAIGKFVPENTYGKPFISELRKDGKWWGDTNDEFPLEDMGIRITHWMHLPEPPKEE